ncbi:hypothetical protein CHS0354_017280 [Potamilus streckersoni]|uniref:Thromboxane A2 receptor n=1 Tax=Potamilus streckersoni TaxID=2493646 RepID=A0AAE0SFK2_9BIVA|nr:hypothetical protein CHS0354_017280 [Potamilus streckersoni]
MGRISESELMLNVTSIAPLFPIDLDCSVSFSGNITKSCNHAMGATIISPILMSLAGVFGNIFALWTLCKMKKDVRTTKFYMFVGALAFTDLLGILITSPSPIATYLNKRQWMGGLRHCTFHGFAMIAFGLSTPFILCAMSVERFLALGCLFFYSNRCHPGTAKGVVLSLWVIAIFLSILPMFGFGRFKVQYPGTWCYLDFHSNDLPANIYSCFYAGINLCIIGIMIFCNGYVITKLINVCLLRRGDLGTLGRKDSNPQSRQLRRKQGHAEIQMIVLMFTITSVFVVCWAPLMLRIILTVSTGESNHLLDLTAVRMASFNQTLDPWLYILLRRSFVIRIKNIFLKVLCFCCRKQETEISVSEYIGRQILTPVWIYRHRIGEFRPHQENVCLIDKQNSEGQGLNGSLGRLPDVMINTENGNVNARLPDVTGSGTESAHYVCRFHISNGEIINQSGSDDCGCRLHISNGEIINQSGSDDDGIYVRFTFLPRTNSDTLVSFKADGISRDVIWVPSRTQSCNSKSSQKEYTNKFKKQTTLSSGYSTKETTAFPMSQLQETCLEPRSEILPVNQVGREILRRTKSNT